MPGFESDQSWVRPSGLKTSGKTSVKCSQAQATTIQHKTVYAVVQVNSSLREQDHIWQASPSVLYMARLYDHSVGCKITFACMVIELLPSSRWQESESTMAEDRTTLPITQCCFFPCYFCLLTTWFNCSSCDGLFMNSSQKPLGLSWFLFTEIRHHHSIKPKLKLVNLVGSAAFPFVQENSLPQATTERT